jgi:hypothetical protein
MCADADENIGDLHIRRRVSRAVLQTEAALRKLAPQFQCGVRSPVVSGTFQVAGRLVFTLEAGSTG